MILSSTFCMVRKHFGLEGAVSFMAEAGFDAIDFSFSKEEFYGKETDNTAFHESFLRLRAFAEEKGLIFNQGHAPIPSSAPEPDKTELIFENIVRAMRNASYLGIPLLVVHPMTHLPYYRDGMPEALFELNIAFYTRLLPYAKEYNIKIGVENMFCCLPNGKAIRHVCATPEEFIRYLDALDKNWFVGCLDIGHAFLVNEKPADFIRRLGHDRLKALHVQDSDGIRDLHTPPYTGYVDWEETAAALREINYDGDFTFEAPYYLSKFPPELYPYAAKLMAETGRHIIRKIEG